MSNDKREISQKDAAVSAVKVVRLNRTAVVKKNWSDDRNLYDRFMQRLNILEGI